MCLAWWGKKAWSRGLEAAIALDACPDTTRTPARRAWEQSAEAGGPARSWSGQDPLDLRRNAILRKYLAIVKWGDNQAIRLPVAGAQGMNLFSREIDVNRVLGSWFPLLELEPTSFDFGVHVPGYVPGFDYLKCARFPVGAHFTLPTPSSRPPQSWLTPRVGRRRKRELPAPRAHSAGSLPFDAAFARRFLISLLFLIR